MHLEPPVHYDNTLQNGGGGDTPYSDKRMEKEAHLQNQQQQPLWRSLKAKESLEHTDTLNLLNR